MPNSNEITPEEKILVNLSPADIARAALHKITEKGLPPTPENFNRHYYDIAGLPSPNTNSAALPRCNEILETVRALVDKASNYTEIIASDVDQRNTEIKQSLVDLNGVREQKQIMALLGNIITTATSMYTEVEATHADLLKTKEALDTVKAEIKETHDWLQRDPLTGTQNRRGMDAALAREVIRSRMNKSKLTVAMIDLDHFKQVNDKFGHNAGDKVLIHIAEIAKSVLRDADILVRYGGEEFLLILPETEVKGAEFVIDRLQKVVNKNPPSYENNKISVSFSCGIAQLCENENGHALIIRADRALYHAKNQGRNCIKVAGQ